MNGKLLAALAFAMFGTEVCLAQTTGPRIEGIVVNGTQNEKPVAGAEVIVRAGAEGSLQPVAQTVTDCEGRFVLDKLPAESGLIFLPGANHQGVHYPGPRIELPRGAMSPLVKVVVFEAVASPSPLVAGLHEIDVHIHNGVLEVTETIVVNNPSLTTYVGQSGNGPFRSTLSVAIPDGFERVTFHKEFLGRRFQLVDKRLVTDIPWTPGKREVKFTYHLPIDESKKSLEWSADAPFALVRLRVHGANAERFECNLSRVANRDHSTIVFESSDLPVNHTITLQLAALPTPWILYLRWSALGVLAGLILATAGFRLVRRSQPIRQGDAKQASKVPAVPSQMGTKAA